MKLTASEQIIVYVASDSAGETGDFAARAALTQFQSIKAAIKRVPFIEDEAAIDRLLDIASQQKALIVFTFVVPVLRRYIIEAAKKTGVQVIDLLGSMIDELEILTGEPSCCKPGMIHRLDEDYFKKVEAVEFAVTYDDGRNPKGIQQADIVLVGVSRTSKTPLSMFLAHKKYKVANVPLVPEIKPPEELFQAPTSKIFGLTINPEHLNKIRTERLKVLGLTSNAIYADHERILRELEYSQEIMKRLNCLVIDVSSKAVEETAGIIIEAMDAAL